MTTSGARRAGGEETDEHVEARVVDGGLSRTSGPLVARRNVPPPFDTTLKPTMPPSTTFSPRLLRRTSGVAHAVLEARDDRVGFQHRGELLGGPRRLRALHAAENDVAVGEGRRLRREDDAFLRDDPAARTVEIREHQTGLLELLLRALPTDEDDVGPVGREAAADVAANRTGPHHADA